MEQYLYRIHAHPPVDSTSLLIHNGIEIVAMLSCLGNSERKKYVQIFSAIAGFCFVLFYEYCQYTVGCVFRCGTCRYGGPDGYQSIIPGPGIIAGSAVAPVNIENQYPALLQVYVFLGREKESINTKK